MTTLLITYRVKPERLAEHLRLLDRVRSELDGHPGDVSWLSHRQSDVTTRFVDLVVTDRPGRFSALESWEAFRAGLDERCDEVPVMTELTPVPVEPERPNRSAPEARLG